MSALIYMGDSGYSPYTSSRQGVTMRDFPREATRFKNLIFVSAALISSAASAQNIDDSWTSELPPVQDVLDYYTDGDELDVAAQRFVAFETIHRGVQLRIGPRVNTNGWTPREKAALDTYREARKEVNDVISDKYSESDIDRYQDYQQRRFDFRSDASFRYDVVQRFAPVLAGVLNPYIASEAGRSSAQAARRLGQNFRAAVFVLSVSTISIFFLYLLIGSWRDKRVSNGVTVEEQESHTLIRYKPGKHGPVAALSIYPLYINIVLFLLTLSVGLIFLFVAVENNEAFNAFMDRNVPDFMVVIIYPEFWIALGLILLFAPWWGLAIANFRRRKTRQIAVTADAIVVGSKTYLLDGLREFYVWGYGDGSPDAGDGGSDIIVGGGNAAARAAVSGAMHAAAIQDSAGLFRRKVGRVSNEIIGEFGEQKHVLAKWLPWKRAVILAEEIGKAIERQRAVQ